MKEIEVRGAGDGVVVVTLARPEKRNAVSLAMWRELGRLFRGFGGDAAVRAVILAGAGGHFSAGADISEFAALRSGAEAARAYEEVADGATAAIRDCPRPTIAAVSGYGVGGGCGIALACDLRVGDATTRMGIPAAKRGIVYGPPDTGLLLRAVGLSAAKLILFSGRLLDAAECHRLGLLDVLAPEGSALRAAQALAAEIAANAPLSVAGAKLVLEAMARGEAEARAAEIQAAIGRAVDSADYREASRAFLEKRPPVFVGA
ncbi:3-hydroxybutyryl-CoA dehydratase [Caldovatus sediminis]|uniref:3-hydroxybutyryl-CoA dehydratase n=1 Tax=Caldovatus sediminis TaxID=2041189 RepID=A0A8J3EAV1_9PROT|nr:enoyl-CoA hydratase-related protein [Caldovatus sediminis]GGG19502.1 3-hydroxybutyryl-CoA dehydratase [Caldovatus sediminis]